MVRKIDIGIDFDIDMVWWYPVLWFDLLNVSKLFEHLRPKLQEVLPEKSKTFPRDVILGLQIWVYIPDT